MRYTGPKNRISRREGLDLGLKTAGSKAQASLMKRLNVKPGQHGLRTKRKTSEYGRQVREKQKLKYIFGVTENQMKNYFKKAKVKTGNTGRYLSEYLEKRLDNVVYRLGFAPTRASARQLVSHGNIKVNNGILTIPSYQVRSGDVITFSTEKIQKTSYIENMINKKDLILPEWLDRKAVLGKVISTPSAEDIEKQINLRLVIEYYSR